MRGRPTKPTNLKLVEGNKGKRAIKNQEPDPEYLNDLSPPAWLSEGAKKVWTEVVPHLRAAKLLTKLDVEMLSMGCDAIAQYRRSSQLMGDKYLVDKSGNEKSGKESSAEGHMNPYMIIQSMAFKRAMAVFQQFGMSPAARTRIAVNPQGELFDEEDTKKSGNKGYFS